MTGHFILTKDGRRIARLRGEILVLDARSGELDGATTWELFLQCDTAAWAHDGESFQILGPSRHLVPGMAVCHDNGVLLVVGSGPPP